MNTNFIVPGV